MFYNSNVILVLGALLPILVLATSTNEITYVSECCRDTIFSSSQKLKMCVNASAEQTLLDGWISKVNNDSPSQSLKKTNHIKKAKIAFVSYATKSIDNYASYAFAVNQAYIEAQGQIMRLVDPLSNNYEPRDVRWNKVMILQNALSSWASECEFIVWLDADLILLDLGMDLTEIIAQYPAGELWVSKSTSTDLMNSGLLIIRNSKFITTWLLPEWWRHTQRHLYSDQEAFNMLYDKFKVTKNLETKIILVKPDALNSDPPAAVRQQDHNQVLHLMGNLDIYRTRVFSSAFREICRVVYPSNKDNDYEDENEDDNESAVEVSTVDLKAVKHQLGVDQQNLLAILLELYRIDLNKAIEKFEATFAQSDDRSDLKPAYNNFDFMTHLSKLSNQYAEGLDVVEAQWTDKDISAFRKGKTTSFDRILLKIDSVYRASDQNNTALIASGRGLLGVHPMSAAEVREHVLRLFFRNTDAQKKSSTVQTKEEYSQERSSFLFNILDAGLPLIKTRLSMVVGQVEQDVSGKSDFQMPARTPYKSEKDRKAELERVEALTEIIDAYGDEMLKITPVERHGHINTLRGGILMAYANIHQIKGDSRGALKQLKRALEASQSAAEIAFPQHLSHTAAMVADAHCRLQEFKESYKYFDLAISTFERSVGVRNPQLAMWYLQFGSAHAASSGYERGFELTEKAVKMMQQLGMHQEIARAEQQLQLITAKLGSTSTGRQAKSKSKKKSKNKNKNKAKSKKNEL